MQDVAVSQLTKTLNTIKIKILGIFKSQPSQVLINLEYLNFDTLDEETLLTEYKKLVNKALKNEIVDFKINTHDAYIGRKQLRVLKKAYCEVVPQRNSSGFLDFLVNAIPIIGGIVATKKQNDLIVENNIQRSISITESNLLNTTIQEINDMHTHIIKLYEKLSCIADEQRQRDEDCRLEILRITEESKREMLRRDEANKVAIQEIKKMLPNYNPWEKFTNTSKEKENNDWEKLV